MGYDVTYKTTASDKGISAVRTPDLWVNSIGKVDVYTPQTKNLGNIVKAIEKKDSQTTAVLTQIYLSLQDMQSMSSRLWVNHQLRISIHYFYKIQKGRFTVLNDQLQEQNNVKVGMPVWTHYGCTYNGRRLSI